jgi:FMN-dependent NADH-azoreductase
MNKLLSIKSSPRGERFCSIAAAEPFLASCRKTHLEEVVSSLDLFAVENSKSF